MLYQKCIPALLILSIILNFASAFNRQSQHQPQQSGVTEDGVRRRLENECALDDPATFAKTVYLDLYGNPHLMADSEILTIGNAFLDTYTSLVNCGTSQNYRRLQGASKDSDENYENLGTRWFTLKYKIRGICKGCNQTAALFQYSHLRLQDSCPCQGPQMVDFELQFPPKILNLFATARLTNVQKVRSVAEEVDIKQCSPVQTFTTSNVLLYIDACRIQQSDLDTLARGFLETYNRLNLNNVEVCDPYFREIDSSRTILTLAPGQTLNSECKGDYIQIKLEVGGRCRGCNPSNVTLFDLEATSNFNAESPSTSRSGATSNSRFTTNRYLTGRFNKQSFQTDDHNIVSYVETYVSRMNERSNKETRHLQDTGCKCPLDPLYRSITAVEMSAGINAALPYFLRNSTINVVRILEVEEVDCSPTQDTFEVTIEMTINVAPEDSSSPTDVASKLADSLVQTYNSLANRYCDPYFRRLVEVENLVVTNLAPTRHQRFLQTKSLSVSATIKGKCKGCKGNTILHKNDAVKRRLSRRLSDFSSSADSYRRLQIGDGCFCPIDSIADSAPTKREFLESFEADLAISPLTQSISLITWEEVKTNDTVSDTVRDECNTNDECLEEGRGTLCVMKRCLHEGNPRFTLTWEGDDDVDIVVEAPNGANISYKFPFDAISRGSFDTQFSQVGFAQHVESIVFPMSGGLRGTYKVHIDPFEVANSSDTWTLEVFTVDSGSEPAHVVQGIGNQYDILFDFIGPNVCSIFNGNTECCSDTDCFNLKFLDSICRNRQCVTNGNLSFTLTWEGNDDYHLTVFTPQYQRVDPSSPFESLSGGRYESDSNKANPDLSYHTANVYFPNSITGGEYGYYVFLSNQVRAMDAWKVEVREFGKLLEVQRGRGSSMNFIYRTSTCSNDLDCGLGRICVFNQCINDGTPRFTLFWQGEGLLHLSIRPPNGNVIRRDNIFDSTSGGVFEDDSNDAELNHIQSISFGSTGLAVGGRYNVEIAKSGDNAGIPWTLNVFVYGSLIQSYSGQDNGTLTWDYDFAPFVVLPINE